MFVIIKLQKQDYRKQMNKNKKNKGFTLIELLVAMGIVAVLTGLAAFNFSQSRIRARDIQRKSDLSQMQKAMELYRNDNNGNYPEAGAFQQTLITGGYSKVEFNDPRDGEWSDYYYSPEVDRKTCLENTTDQTKTTDTTICGKFKNPATCSCGATAADSSGVMYTLSQP
jgi:general secretion pathway protein G